MEEMKEAVRKAIDTLTQDDFHGAFQKLLERYNKCIVAGGDYFEGGLSFMCVLSIKVPIRKNSGNLSYAPRTNEKIGKKLFKATTEKNENDINIESKIINKNYPLLFLRTIKTTS